MSERTRAMYALRGAVWRLSILVLGGASSSCLVTRTVDYDQPIIVSQVRRVDPEAEFVRVPVEADEDCEKEGLGYMRFEVEVRDLNREEELSLRVVVNKQFVREYDIAPSGDVLRRLEPPFFCVPEAALLDPCNLVEAVVSASFYGFNGVNPYRVRDEDIASAHWWVIGKAQDNPTAGFADCPDPRPDAGLQ